MSKDALVKNWRILSRVPMFHHQAGRTTVPVGRLGPKIMLEIRCLSLRIEEGGLTDQHNLLFHFFFSWTMPMTAKHESLPR